MATQEQGQVEAENQQGPPRETPGAAVPDGPAISRKGLKQLGILDLYALAEKTGIPDAAGSRRH